MRPQEMKLFHRHFARLLRRFSLLHGQTRRSPSEDHVHRLRVTARKIRALLWLLREEERLPEGRVLEGRLRALGRVLGGQRETDIALRDGRSYHLPVSSLRRAREKNQRAVQAALREPENRLLLRDLPRAGRLLRALRQPKIRPRLKKLARRSEKWRARPLRRGELHALRIEVKKMRYALEAFGHPAERLGKLQDLLGKAHDLEVLRGKLGRRAAAARDEERLARRARKRAGKALKRAGREIGSLA
jgi:CHAD domain-containing protein